MIARPTQMAMDPHGASSTAERWGGDRRGIALLMTMLTAVLVSGLAGALVAVLSTEEAVDANHRRGVAALYAADGILAGVVAELARVPDWAVVLDGSRRSAFATGPISVRLADGSSLDLRQETLALQRETERAGAPGATPRWRRYAWGWFADLVGETDRGHLLYVVAWVGDDRADPDVDPMHDGNGRIVVRAAALGPFRTRRVVEATVGRSAGAVHIVAWGLVR